MGSCTNSYGEYDLSESPIGFLKGLNQVNVSFPTDNPNQLVKFKFKKKQGAIRPSLETALNFVKMNSGHLKTYVRDVYDCKQFAYNLFLDAQKENFVAHFVILDLKNEKEGHALMSIQTHDAGQLYVDFTPLITKDSTQKPSQSVAYVRAGEPYIRIPISALERNFKNTNVDFLMFKAKMEKGDREVESYNRSAEILMQRKKEIEAKVQDFKSRTSNQRVIASNYKQLKEEQEDLEDEIQSINDSFTHLDYEETRIRNLYMETDWIGKSWIVESVKAVP
jgi:hypothetical protein